MELQLAIVKLALHWQKEMQTQRKLNTYIIKRQANINIPLKFNSLSWYAFK
jgi:hypothetical protein